MALVIKSWIILAHRSHFRVVQTNKLLTYNTIIHKLHTITMYDFTSKTLKIPICFDLRGACGTYGGGERCAQGSGGKT